MRKPGEEIFLRVIRENNLVPEETLFIDDSPQHIEGAKKVGLQTLYLEKGKILSELFQS
jgi:putative hydrolase of the HAD superfamily